VSALGAPHHHRGWPYRASRKSLRAFYFFISKQLCRSLAPPRASISPQLLRVATDTPRNTTRA
jgi:hypothetical protein